jgi:hypothetical protein
MGVWLTLLFPLLIWAAHFVGLYLAVEFLPQRSLAAGTLLTLLCFASLLGFWSYQGSRHGLTRMVAGLGTLLALSAMSAQMMPFMRLLVR